MSFGCDVGLGSYEDVGEWWQRMVASMGGVDRWLRWWRRMVASNGGVDGGLGSSTQRALTWKSLCVPGSDGDTHSRSFAFRLYGLQDNSGFLSLCRVLDLRQFAAYLARQFGQLLVSPSHSLLSVSSW